MTARQLSDLQPRPRTSCPRPRYPRVAAFGAVLTACCGGGNPTSQEPSAVVAVSADPPVAASVPTSVADEPVAFEWDPATHFPEDDEPLENVGCRGKCAAPYVLGITKKDEGQIEARIRYCANAALRRGDASKGSVAVIAQIAGSGKATKVGLTPTGEVSESVLDCVRTMVSAAPFTSEHDLERRTGATGKIGR